MTTSSTGDLMIVLRVPAEHLLDHVVHFLGESFSPLHCFPLSILKRLHEAPYKVVRFASLLKALGVPVGKVLILPSADGLRGRPISASEKGRRSACDETQSVGVVHCVRPDIRMFGRGSLRTDIDRHKRIDGEPSRRPSNRSNAAERPRAERCNSSSSRDNYSWP
jgi:hypothetical protein